MELIHLPLIVLSHLVDVPVVVPLFVLELLLFGLALPQRFPHLLILAPLGYRGLLGLNSDANASLQANHFVIMRYFLNLDLQLC